MKFHDDDDDVYSEESIKQAVIEARLWESDLYQNRLNHIKQVVKFTNAGRKYPIKSNSEVLAAAIDHAYEEGHKLNIPEKQIKFDVESALKGMTRIRKKKSTKANPKRKITKKCKCK